MQPNKRKGHVPWNKGLKGIRLSPHTMFKKGQTPHNLCSVGTVRIRPHGPNKVPRAFIKVSEPNTWRYQAVVVWETHNGPVPKGYVVHHEDHNTLNDTIGNLKILSRAEHLAENRQEIQEIKKHRLVYTPKKVTCSRCAISYDCKRRDTTRPNLCQQCKQLAVREAHARYRARKKNKGLQHA